tara:strand:- start:3258 stop:3767 length:510 start_codon:yes stop_codon:yes gene_type:complete
MKDKFNNLSGNVGRPTERLPDIFNKASGSNHLIDDTSITLPKKRPAPFSLRLSFNERQELEQRAENAGVTMGSYCKYAIFDIPPPRRAKRPVRDKAELAQLLGAVGKIGNNLNQIARQLNVHGSVEVSELQRALEDLTLIRESVMKALGYAEDDSAALFPDSGVQRNDH